MNRIELEVKSTKMRIQEKCSFLPLGKSYVDVQ